jgi:hypothetical protein
MLRPKDRDAAEYGDLEALVRREVRKLALNRSLGRLDKPEPRKHSILKACSQWEPSICAFRRSRTAFRDAPEQANRLAQALMLCFLQRRFSSFFAMGYGNLSADIQRWQRRRKARSTVPGMLFGLPRITQSIKLLAAVLALLTAVIAYLKLVR